MTGDMMLNRIGNIDAKYILEGEPEMMVPTTRRRRRRVLPLLIAAVLILAFSMVAAAAVHREWNVDILNFMGLSDANTVQLEDGMVEINVSDTQTAINVRTGEQEEITFTADASIGDRYNACIRILTDIEVPEDFDPEHEFYLTDTWGMSVENGRGNGHAGWMKSVIVDDHVAFMIYLTNTEKLNTSQVTVTLGDIRMYHDWNLAEDEEATAENELVYEGTWQMSWKYNYHSVYREVSTFHKIMENETPVYITGIEVTPLEVRVNGYFSRFQQKGGMSHIDEIESVTLRDGTVIDLTDVEGGGGFGNSGWYGMLGLYRIHGSALVGSLGQLFPVDDVVSVRVHGVDIPLS